MDRHRRNTNRLSHPLAISIACLFAVTLSVVPLPSVNGYHLSNALSSGPVFGRPSTADERQRTAASGVAVDEDVKTFVGQQIEMMEEKIGRRIDEQSRKLNQSVAIQYLEKVLDYISEETQLNRELLVAKRDDRQRQIEQLDEDMRRQRADLERWSQTVDELAAVVDNLTERLDAASGKTRVVTPATGDGGRGSQRRTTSGPTPQHVYPIDCQQAYEKDESQFPTSGFQIASIEPLNSGNRDIFRTSCYVVNSTSWTLIQRREDGSVNFYRNWSDYRTGFGRIEGEFWLGNDRIHRLTSQGDYRLRVEMVTWDGQPHWAEYEHFRVASAADKYRLHVAGFVPTSDAGDSLTSAWDNDHNGMQFSTYDSDNDVRFYDNCAQHYHGAWWFRSCFQSHLNGVYYPRGAHSNFFVRNGVQWNTIHPHSSLRHVVMMVRRNGGDVTAAGDDITSNGLE